MAGDEPGRSLRLLAASQRFHTVSGIARFSLQADRFERARNTAQAELDSVDATAYWDAGSQLSLDEAIAYARRGRGERQRPQIGWASLTPVVRLIAGAVDDLTTGGPRPETEVLGPSDRDCVEFL
ncbi:MAG: hypothetical protein M3400_15195 [Actinomycetota bacterium]|nr:hypothetical protein [Actinomycetota bacterium]